MPKWYVNLWHTRSLNSGQNIFKFCENIQSVLLKKQACIFVYICDFHLFYLTYTKFRWFMNRFTTLVHFFYFCVSNSIYGKTLYIITWTKMLGLVCNVLNVMCYWHSYQSRIMYTHDMNSTTEGFALSVVSSFNGIIK